MCNHEDYPCCGCDDGPLSQHEFELQQESAREQEEAEEWDDDYDDDDEYDDDVINDDVDIITEMQDYSQAMGGPDEDFGCYGGDDPWGDQTD